MGCQCLTALLSEECTLLIAAKDHDCFWSGKQGRKPLNIYSAHALNILFKALRIQRFTEIILSFKHKHPSGAQPVTEDQNC